MSDETITVQLKASVGETWISPDGNIWKLTHFSNTSMGEGTQAHFSREVLTQIDVVNLVKTWQNSGVAGVAL